VGDGVDEFGNGITYTPGQLNHAIERIERMPGANKRRNQMTEPKCSNPALFRYTWPGENERFGCLEHSVQIQNVAKAIGLNLQMIQVDQRNEIDKNNKIKECSQFIKD